MPTQPEPSPIPPPPDPRTDASPSRPTEAELASAPTAWLPWELGFVPELPEVPGLARCEPAADVASKAVA